MSLFYPLVLFLLVGAVLQAIEGCRCNEVLCASVVSKCMLTQACKCDISRDQEKCTCLVDCAKCLGRYYNHCCSCLKMCDDEVVELDPNDSQVGDYAYPFPQLFAALAGEEAAVEGLVLTYEADLPMDEMMKKHHKHKFKKDSYKNNGVMPQRSGVNCTVIFLSQCHSALKCREQCKQIGAASYRFFFDGCCECIGDTCLNYGINQSKCPLCSNLEDDYYEENYLADAAVSPIMKNELEEDYIL